jgi:hypothetical protein
MLNFFYITASNLAYPIEDLNSRVMSLLINQEGTVFEKDFDNKTTDLAMAMTEFNIYENILQVYFAHLFTEV